MKRPLPPPAGPMKIIVIAVAFMLLADHFIFEGKRGYIEEARTVPAAPVETVRDLVGEDPLPGPLPEGRGGRDEEEVFFDAPLPEMMEEPDIVKAPDTPVPEKPVAVRGRPKIAIIIDDLGMDIKHTKETINLPAPVTLAFLPYAPRVRDLAAEGKKRGHSLIIHVPMEAMDGKLNIGPGGLYKRMSAAELRAAFDVMLASFDGYEGINNHMGSRLTQDEAAMGVLMEVLREKGLFFVDSKTIQSSVAAREAKEAGILYAERDVFLDHVESRAYVDGALARAESLARRRGHAVVIGHPKMVTLDALRAWIPTLEGKGIELVPVGDLVW